MPTLRLDEVVYDKSIYPRENWNNHTVDSFADVLKAGGEFPAIVLEENTNRLLDGMHRWKAYQKYLEQYQEHQLQITLEGISQDEWAPAREDIDVTFTTIPEDIPAKLFAANFSTKHGDRIPLGQRKAIAREVCEANPDFSCSTIAHYLDVSKSSAWNYIADIKARRREQQRMTAYRLHRLGWTKDEIAEIINTSPSNVQNFRSQFPELEKVTKNLLTEGIPHTDISERFQMPLILVWAIDLQGRPDAQRMECLDIKVYPYDVWNFSSCNNLFGASYPGRIPGQLVAHILYFFTGPGDTIVDPMAGSGTVLDVCLAMGRKCYAYDIESDRPDIIEHNLARDTWPDRIKKANLIFWDPPYFDKMDDNYPEESISALPRDEYIQFFETRLREAYELAKRGTQLAFLMSDWDDDTGEREGIFIWDYANIIKTAGWKLIRHIQVPLPTQLLHGDIVVKFRKSRRLARLERYLLIAEK